MDTFLLIPHIYSKLLCLSVLGRKDTQDSSAETGIPCFVHGYHHRGVLPSVLDAIWCRGHDGYIWPARNHLTGGQRGALSPRQEQHGHQPAHIHPDEQTGNSTN